MSRNSSSEKMPTDISQSLSLKQNRSKTQIQIYELETGTACIESTCQVTEIGLKTRKWVYRLEVSGSLFIGFWIEAWKKV